MKTNKKIIGVEGKVAAGIGGSTSKLEVEPPPVSRAERGNRV